MMGCKGNYSLSGDLCQNTKTLYRTLFLHTLRIAHSFSGIPLIEEQYVYMYAIHMCALSGIGNVPGVSAIFYGSGDFIYVYTGNNRLTRILSILIGKIILKIYIFHITFI